MTYGKIHQNLKLILREKKKKGKKIKKIKIMNVYSLET